MHACGKRAKTASPSWVLLVDHSTAFERAISKTFPTPDGKPSERFCSESLAIVRAENDPNIRSECLHPSFPRV